MDEVVLNLLQVGRSIIDAYADQSLPLVDGRTVLTAGSRQIIPFAAPTSDRRLGTYSGGRIRRLEEASRASPNRPCDNASTPDCWRLATWLPAA